MSLLFRALAAILLLPILAGAAQATPSMRLGAEAPAPAGYIAFCQRRPAECGIDPADVVAVTQAAWLAAAAGGSAAEAPAAVAAMDDGALPALGPGLWSRLSKVNVEVNRAIRAQVDPQGYGVADYWAMPIQDGRRAGDCEDYVLEKIRALTAGGMPRGALSIALVTTPRGEAHAVLVVSTRAGDFVLDNLSAQVRRWDDVPYVWRLRQVDALRWARVAAASPE